jgi:glycosyltransferase involved in cell wall biosynthesis
MRKKKVVLHSNSTLAYTGFGRSMRFLMSYLFKTGKYDLVEYAAAPLTWSHPICKAMPWKCYGALPDNPRELDQFRDDPVKLTAIQYGAYNINRVLSEEKPDLLLMSEDIWGMPYFDQPWIGKFPHVFWTPIDSLPLLGIFHEQKERFGNLWVKAKFAQEELSKFNIQSKYVPDLIGTDDFRVFSEEERNETRRKYGIADDTLVFGFVFRNQLRKLVGTLIEGFAKFKKERPDVKCKLFLHTHWSEPEGWRIPDFANRFGVRREDIITTYVCKECKSVSVKPFYGEEMPCQVCREEKTCNTSGVSVGVTEEELCELYNMCDAYIHPVTSGGFEMPVLEAILSGLPVATTDYAFGKNYTEHPNVFALKFFTYTDKGSQFDKAQVDPNSIHEFMNYISNLSREERKDIAKNVREWASKEFDGNKICQEIEKFIDDLPFTDYDFDFKQEGVEEKPSLESMLDLNGKKRILYVEPGSLGDCLDALQVLEVMSKKYPPEEWDYYVATVFPKMFDHLPFLKKTLQYDPIFDDVHLMEGIEDHKGYFDMSFHPKSVRNNPNYFKNDFLC